jgi:hypothetical protein
VCFESYRFVCACSFKHSITTARLYTAVSPYSSSPLQLSYCTSVLTQAPWIRTSHVPTVFRTSDGDPFRQCSASVPTPLLLNLSYCRRNLSPTAPEHLTNLHTYPSPKHSQKNCSPALRVSTTLQCCSGTRPGRRHRFWGALYDFCTSDAAESKLAVAHSVSHYSDIAL